MTGKGYDAFVKVVFGFWFAVIAIVVALIAMIIFAPWLIPVLLLVAGAVIWHQRQANLSK
ncbi:hypothetical protein KBI23_09485 [bacterium]|nr:hypothetical protein [bacterium]MBP9810516.1 hypothetical protein [bacterium]